MAKQATANEPSAEAVLEAVDAIEKLDADLLAEKMAYMTRCKNIRKIKADEFDNASNHGISKKLLKKKIKERGLKRKIVSLTAELEDDERSEYEMLSQKLGEFAETPLGAAAMAAAAERSTGTLRSVGL